jgi:uncharacterized phiE125 gp8 family phage protein
MSLSLITPPVGEPVTLADAKAHLRIDTPDDDALITALISAARARAEWHTGRAFMTQSWILWLDSWPENGIVEIPLPPLATVSAVTLYARDDTATLLDPARFVVDLAGGRIALRQSTILPPLLRVIDAIQVAFTAGYGDATAVPQPLKTAILETVVFLYEHRGDAPADLPQGVQALLAPYRVFKL